MTYAGEFKGGSFAWLTNKTGAASVKGTMASPSATTDLAFDLVTNQYDAIGVVFDDGVPDGGLCRVVINGLVQVLFENGNAPVREYWLRASTVAGRGYNEAAPSGGGFVNAAEHFKEVGHVLESKTAGTDVLAWCLVHFN
jgi:hypothetical protein